MRRFLKQWMSGHNVSGVGAMVVAVAQLVVLAGCGGKTSEAIQQVGDGANKTAKQAVLSSSKWATPCQAASSLQTLFGLPAQIEALDMGSSLAKTTTMYREGSCANGLVQVVENGSYSLEGKITDDTFQLNQRFDSVTVKPLNQEGADNLNARKLCGFNDWASGTAKDVTAKSTDGWLSALCWIKTPRALYDIVQINTNQLKFGLIRDGKDKTTPDNRPTALDQATVFNKN